MPTKFDHGFSHENKNMSMWIRMNLPQGSDGFKVSDVDYVLQNFKTKKVIILEVKMYNKIPETWQRTLFQNLHRWIKRGIDSDWQYLGFHFIRFENTSFFDGKVYFDNVEISEEELIARLSF